MAAGPLESVEEDAFHVQHARLEHCEQADRAGADHGDIGAERHFGHGCFGVRLHPAAPSRVFRGGLPRELAGRLAGLRAPGDVVGLAGELGIG